MNLPGNIDLRMATAVWRRNFTVYKHTWVTNILPNFFEPVLFLLGMGMGVGVYVGRGMQGQDYVAYIAPGLIGTPLLLNMTHRASLDAFND